MKQDVSQAGFTMVEVLTTLLVLALLLVMVTPSFQNSMQNAQLNSEINALAYSLNFAKTTALSQSTNVMVCPFSSPGATTCGSNWSDGWIVVTQPISGTPTLLQTHQIKSNGPKLSVTGGSAVLFSSRGLSQAQMNFTLCDLRGANYAMSLVVMATGYIQTSTNQGVSAWSGGGLSCP